MLQGALLALLLAVSDGALVHHQCGTTPIQPNLNHGLDGPVKAVPYSWPWQVVVYRRDDFHSCGGSVIHNNWVITVIDCVRNIHPENVYVKAGVVDYMATTDTEASAQIVNVSEVIRRGKSPFVLLRLATPLNYTNQVQPVCLASVDAEQTLPPSTGWIAGWGFAGGNQTDHQLKQANLPIVNMSICETEFAWPNRDTEKMFCAAGNGVNYCEGNLGDPIVQQGTNGSWWQYGVFGANWSQNWGCFGVDKPALYQRIRFNCDWIAKQTHNEVTCSDPDPETRGKTDT